MFAGFAGNLGMQALTAGAPVAGHAAGWAAGDFALAIAAGAVAAIAIVMAARLDRRVREARTPSTHTASSVPALPARG